MESNCNGSTSNNSRAGIVSFDCAPLRLSMNGVPLKGVLVGPDSAFIRNFLTNEEQLRLLQSSDGWNWMDRNDSRMLYRGNAMTRTKKTMVNDLSRIPVYRYPGFQYASIQAYEAFYQVPEVNVLVDRLNGGLKYSLGNDEEMNALGINHVIATRYEDGDDSIGFHSDKVEDIAKESLILILSTGARRELHLRKVGEASVCFVVVMQPASLFVLGPQTNIQYEHSIVPVGDERYFQRKDVSARLSLVLRNISTMMTCENVKEKIKKSEHSKEVRREKREAKREKEESDEDKDDVVNEYYQKKVPKIEDDVKAKI
mgnify:CR=1 FL=1